MRRCWSRSPGAAVEFRLLGEVELRVGQRPLEVGTRRQQAVLAALVVDAERPVDMETLIDRIWDDAPPVRARDVLYSHISRIRRLLAEAAAAGETPARIEHRPAGYLLSVDPDAVDLHRFRRQVQRARDPGCGEAERLVLLREALGLWRGTPLAGIAGRWAADVRDRCRQQRLDASISWAEAELRAGHPDRVLSVVPDLVAEHPLVEPLQGLLIRALHAAGREAEALDRYTRVRQRLVEELGVEPGAELRGLHGAILRGDLPATRPTRVPAQLPADVHCFTGRDTELAELDSLIAAPSSPPSAVVISAVTGTAGVGKTALAVHWAHQVQDRFPDGQLYVNLRGYDPALPVSPNDALAGLLAALGVAGQDVSLDVEERAARYRTEVAGRRMLILLDNARTAEQVRPLLPGAPSCLVVVTSRDSLPALVSRDGARRLDLNLLSLTDAVELLRTLVGDRVDIEADAAVTLARQCARLPLALRVAAERAAAHPRVPLSRLVQQLADQQRRLDLLDVGGDPRAAVRGVFSWSYQHLAADAARAFRLLGLHPAADFDAYAATALVGTTLDHAQQLLDTLTGAHLLEPAARPPDDGGGGERYRMHDLMRAYAADLAAVHDGKDEQQEALTRLFDYYVATAAAAMDIWYPADQRHRPHVDPPGTPTPTLGEAGAARAWLDAERSTLRMVGAYTAAHGWPAHTTLLSRILHRHFVTPGNYPDALALHTYSLSAAHALGDQREQAHALTNLGAVHRRMGRYSEASLHLQMAVDRHRETGDKYGEARALTNLGVLRQVQGLHSQSAGHLRLALDLHRETGDKYGEAHALTNLGVVYRRIEQYGRAIEYLLPALELHREIGDRSGTAHALTNLGAVYRCLGASERAADHLHQALTIFRDIGDRDGEAYALTNLAAVRRGLGQYAQAVDELQRAFALYSDIGDRDGEADVLNSMGETQLAAGHPADALAQHTAALEAAIEAGDRDEQARAHNGLGHTHRILHNPDHARRHWQHALALYMEMEAPDADEVRTHLVALDRPRMDES
jgi:DNA-binding SARP family transcriptional activator/tetratricopeptide (TPR) repeat protein